MTVLQYKEMKHSLRITNLENLPKGLGCHYLICIEGEDKTLIAKQWKRRQPQTLQPSEILVSFVP